MPSRPAAELLGLPVRFRGIELGRTVDVLVDVAARRGVGLDVLCGDGVQRFLPLSGATIGDDEIGVDSPLVLIEPSESTFYRARSSSLRQLSRGVVGDTGGARDGFGDVVIGADGEIDAASGDAARGW